MNSENQPHPEPTLPESLIEDLKKLHEPPVLLDDSVDRRILEDVRRTLDDSERRQTTSRRSRWAAAAAAAAMFTAAVGVGNWFLWSRLNQTGPPSDPTVAAAGIEDLDRNGRIDMLDAFAEDHCECGRNVGRVDQQDLDVLAASAVRLKGDN